MPSVAKPSRQPRRPHHAGQARDSTNSTITVRDLAGRTWEGAGDSTAAAVRDLGRRHAAAQPAQMTGAVGGHATVTPLGVLALTEADLADLHPPDCPGCPTCRTILPRLRRALVAAAAGAEEPE